MSKQGTPAEASDRRSGREAPGWLAAALVAALSGITLPVAAADVDIGLTLGPANGRTDCIDGLPCSHGGSFAKLSAGYHPAGGLELDASYFHAGTFKGRDQTSDGTVYGGDFKTDAFGLTAGYGWRFSPGWRLSGRAGAAILRAHFDYDAPFSGSVGKTTLQPLLGVGLVHAVTPALSVGVDYDETRFKVHASHGPLRMPGASLYWTF